LRKRHEEFEEENCVNVQKYINKKYPTQEDREKETKLDISYKNLEEDLNLSEFKNLEEVHLQGNNIAKVTFSSSANERLKVLSLKKNNKLGKDLNLIYFSCFSNLEILNISNTSFSGSLKSLESLTNLKKINIRRTNINGGLEYLPKSVEKISFDSGVYPDIKA